MFRTPLCASLRTSSIFVSTGIEVFSFCSPSLGPTSTIRTSSAGRRGVVENRLAARRGIGFAQRAMEFVVVLNVMEN